MRRPYGSIAHDLATDGRAFPGIVAISAFTISVAMSAVVMSATIAISTTATAVMSAIVAIAAIVAVAAAIVAMSAIVAIAVIVAVSSIVIAVSIIATVTAIVAVSIIAVSAPAPVADATWRCGGRVCKMDCHLLALADGEACIDAVAVTIGDPPWGVAPYGPEVRGYRSTEVGPLEGSGSVRRSTSYLLRVSAEVSASRGNTARARDGLLI